MNNNMKIKSIFIATIAASVLAGAFPAVAEPGVAFRLCNESGVCTPIEPSLAMAYVAADLLTTELNKGPNAFGSNNEIMKALNEINKFIEHGMGPTNDFRMFFEQSGFDLLFKNLGIHLFG